MTQKSDKFTLYIHWNNPKDRGEEEALTKYILNSLNDIRKKFPKCGLEWHHTNRLVNRNASRIDVIFKLKPNLSQWGSIEKENYNHFVGAVRLFDELTASIPQELNPTGTYSTTDYKAPWVQRNETRSLGLVVRKGVAVAELTQKVIDRIPRITETSTAVKSVKVIGEPTEVNKVIATIRQFVKRKNLTVDQLLGTLLYDHNNTRWMVLFETEDKQCYAYGYSALNRESVSLETIRDYERPLVALKPKYPDTKIFGADMYVLPV